MVAGPDSVHVDEMQAGRLGILYMRLSEHYNDCGNYFLLSESILSVDFCIEDE